MISLRQKGVKLLKRLFRILISFAIPFVVGEIFFYIIPYTLMYKPNNNFDIFIMGCALLYIADLYADFLENNEEM